METYLKFGIVPADSRETFMDYQEMMEILRQIPPYPCAYLQACQSKVAIELETLAYHSDPKVRAQVARCSRNADLLQRLAWDTEPSVLVNVVFNNACTAQTIRDIADRMVCSESRYCMVWYALVVHTATPQNLRLFYINKEWVRRLACYTKPDAPIPEYIVNISFWQDLQ